MLVKGAPGGHYWGYYTGTLSTLVKSLQLLLTNDNTLPNLMAQSTETCVTRRKWMDLLSPYSITNKRHISCVFRCPYEVPFKHDVYYFGDMILFLICEKHSLTITNLVIRDDISVIVLPGSGVLPGRQPLKTVVNENPRNTLGLIVSRDANGLKSYFFRCTESYLAPSSVQ